MKATTEKKRTARKIDRKPLNAAQKKLEELMLSDLKQRGIVK